MQQVQIQKLITQLYFVYENTISLEYHSRKMIMPVVDCLVTRLVACDASQNMFNCMLFPRGFGAFEGRLSLMSG